MQAYKYQQTTTVVDCHKSLYLILHSIIYQIATTGWNKNDLFYTSNWQRSKHDTFYDLDDPSSNLTSLSFFAE